MDNFETLLEGSAAAHGHLCAGQVIGVRMAMLGLQLIGLEDPKNSDQIKKLIVYVEIDRCATDAISYVTGVQLGRRSMKFMDYGINAATFVNLETGCAFRIVSTEKARGLASEYAPGIENKNEQQLTAYKVMPLEALFEVEEVDVDIPPEDVPGPSRLKAICQKCGITVRDGREVRQQDKMICHSCAGIAYYQNPRKVKHFNLRN